MEKEIVGVNGKWRNDAATSRLHAMPQTRHAPRMTSGFDVDRIGGPSAVRGLEELVLRAGETAMKHFRRGVVPEKKPDLSPVTAADREVEAMIRDYVLANYPHAEFYGEETGRHGDNPDLRFIVDPIDGTRAFVRGMPTWSVLLGIEAAGVPVVGIAYMPAADDLFVGVHGGGASHNGEAAYVSNVAPLSDAMVTHGALQQFTETGFGDALLRVAEASDAARGFADFDGYRQVLLGRADAMIDPGVKPYDICAAAVLIREAGGRFTSIDGEETIYKAGAIASNGLIHDELVAVMWPTPKD